MNPSIWLAATTPAERATAALVVGLCASLPASAECRLVQFAELPVNASQNRPVVPGAINGQPVRILVDTGAQLSVITRATAKRLSLMQLSTSGSARGIGGETYVYSTSVKQLTLDKYSVRNLTLPVIAVDAGPAFDMILGENFFSHSTVEFDLAHSAIRLFDPKGCHAEQLSYWSTAYQLADLIASPVDSNRIETTVLLNGKALRAVLDTGAMFSIVSLTAAATAGVTPDSPGVKPAGRWHGVGRNVVDSWIGTFDSFTIGDETIRNAKLVIQDRTKSDEVKALQSRIPVSVEASPMLIGADFFLAHRVLIYGAERKMVFTYLGGPVFDTLHVHPEAPTAAGSDDRPQTQQPPDGPR